MHSRPSRWPTPASNDKRRCSGELFGFLETRRREAEVAEQVELPSVRILDHASEPIDPTSPSWATSLAWLPCSSGLGGGLALAFYQEFTDSRVRDRREVELGTGLSVIGIIPSAAPGRELCSKGRSSAAGSPEAARPARREEVVREAFRGLLTDLEFIQSDRGGRRSPEDSWLSCPPVQGKGRPSHPATLPSRGLPSGRTRCCWTPTCAPAVCPSSSAFPSLTGLTEVLAGEVPRWRT